MSELEKPITGQELADILAMALIETVAAVSRTPKLADERLEDIASHLLDLPASLQGNPRMAALFEGLAASLVQTEQGAQDTPE